MPRRRLAPLAPLANPNQPPHSARARLGFTLTELLVVIGIIALLMALGLPAAAKARSAALRLKCAAQLNELSKAFQGYLNDSKGRVPYVNPLPDQSPTRFDGPPIWNAFDTYLRNNRVVWSCPSDRAINVGNEFPADKDTYASAFGLSYEYNFWMNSAHGGKPFREALTDAEQKFAVMPDEFRIFNDFTHFHGKAGTTGNMNFLFADWHVGDLGGADGVKIFSQDRPA